MTIMQCARHRVVVSQDQLLQEPGVVVQGAKELAPQCALRADESSRELIDGDAGENGLFLWETPGGNGRNLSSALLPTNA
jgi:hypothetical protein